MALEASDRLIDIIWVNWRCTCGCISRPTFQRSASLLDIMGKSKEISQDLRKTIVDLYKSGSSLGAISKMFWDTVKSMENKSTSSQLPTALRLGNTVTAPQMATYTLLHNF